MLDKLIELIIQFIELFRFWIVLQPYEEAVQVRLGHFLRVLGPGFHWKLPFGVDYIISEHVVPTTHSLGDESVTSQDGKSVGFHAVVTYRISNIQKATLEVSDSDHAVRDSTCGEIGRVMRESTWEQMLQADLPERLTSACRKRGWKYGIEILGVQLAGLALVRSIRLMQK